MVGMVRPLAGGRLWLEWSDHWQGVGYGWNGLTIGRG